MKIRRLVIQNVASIESAELDFENGPLGDAPLFLICGETGAGKTTILDCITLALYGRTPRYDGSGVKNPQAIGGYAYNDARQLVRRGATSASATLSLLGNDGRPYVAEWSVEAVSRGANKGSLKAAVWTWKDGSPGGATWTKVKECHAAVARAVGLAFEQFCRTTLLAQGQFTKFLMGTPDEKAEILEKLTDTSKYTELGKAIAAKWTQLDAEVKALDTEVDRMTGLGAARGEVERRLAELETQMADLGQRREAETARLRWLQRRGELERNVQAVSRALIDAFAALRAAERQASDDAARAAERLASLRASLAAAADKAAMYESADVILQTLSDVREARRARAAAARDLDRHRGLLPARQKDFADAAAALEKAAGELAAAQARVADAEKDLEALGRAGVQKSRNAAAARRGALESLRERIGSLAKTAAGLSDREQQLAARRAELSATEGTLPALRSAAEDARAAVVRARTDRDVQKKLVDDGIEKLVSDLRVGDTCPVCGHTIDRLHAEGHFTALFRELDGRCAAAEAACTARECRYNEAAASVHALRKAIEREAGWVAGERENIAHARDAVSEAAQRMGLQDASDACAAAALDACGAEIAAYDAQLAEFDRREKAVKALRAEVDRLVRTKDSAAAGLAAAEKSVAACEHQMNMCVELMAAGERRAAAKLADVSGRVSAAELAAWERDAASVEKAFRAAADAYAARKDELPRAENAWESLERTKELFAACAARAVAKMPALGAVAARDGNTTSMAIAEMEGLLGRWEESQDSLERHMAARPEGLAADDTESVVAARAEALKAEVETSASERGRCQQQLADDDQCAAARAAKRAEADRLRAARDEWLPIHSCFGDGEGKKIRREIQSYVLANVLVKANHYLEQLENRYTLSCEGLTLSVKDAFAGGLERPVNTLSGGEQFLVSLALALGLAGMSDAGLGVDVLLIDEGFGTLSGAHLDAALAALERLNALTGARKVGVISHVERLRERIRTHIEVARNGQSPSVVRVVASARHPVAVRPFF